MATDKEKEAEDKTEGTDGGGGGKSGMAMIIAAALISLGMGAGGAFFFASSQVPSAAPPTSMAPVDTAAQAEADTAASNRRSTEDFKERLYGLDPFVVNVTGDGYNRFLKLRIELETNNVSIKEELDARLPQVRDALIVLLSSKQLSDITDFEGKALLKEDILERVNDLLETGDVRSILFTEFVVQ